MHPSGMKRLILLLTFTTLLLNQLNSSPYRVGCQMGVTAANLEHVRSSNTVEFTLATTLQFVGEPCTEVLGVGIRNTLRQGLCKQAGLAGSASSWDRNAAKVTLNFEQYSAPAGVNEREFLEVLLKALQAVAGSNGIQHFELKLQNTSDEYSWMLGNYPATNTLPPGTDYMHWMPASTPAAQNSTR